MNPVRAQMVQTPCAYPWSSYSANGLGQTSKLISPHLLYLELGQQADDRLTSYRALFKHALKGEELHKIRTTCQSGTL